MPKQPTNTTEVVAHPENDRRRRRNFSTEEKLRILAEADRCTGRGEVGALMRREGIYSSLLSDWRKQLRTRGEAGLAAKTPGRKPTRDARDRQLEKLEREKAKLEQELRMARALIELAGKAHEILGVALPSIENGEEL
jgi:transposase